MSIPVASSFKRGSALPLDEYAYVADTTARNAIPDSARYLYMECTLLDTGVKYRLEGGLTNSNWVEIATNLKTVNGSTLLGSGDLIVNSIPQNSQSAAYTTVLADANKHIYHPSADTTDRTWTIDSNANVAYPIGTAITFVNDSSAGVITIAITSDTMVLQPAGTTGSRTLAANGNATALKVAATRWVISGVNLT
jgi:hypothetical protein